jgi:hypothetical protein
MRFDLLSECRETLAVFKRPRFERQREFGVDPECSVREVRGPNRKPLIVDEEELGVNVDRLRELLCLLNP